MRSNVKGIRRICKTYAVLGGMLGFVVLSGCDEKTLTPIVTFPTVTISNPNEGAQLTEDVLILMKGLVEDSSFADDLEKLNPTWSVDGIEVCPDAVVDSTGETLCSHSFDSKDGVAVTLKVTNPTGGASEFTVVVDVLENSIPQVVLKSPVASKAYYSDLKVDFEAEVSDGEDDPEDLLVSWTSDEDGALTDLDGPPTSSGFHGGAALLSEGQHRIEVLVTDSGGKTHSESVSITVGQPNTAPTCSIDSPVDGSVWAFGDVVEFKGTVADPDISASDLTVTWTSSVDGLMFSGNPASSGETRINYSALSQNNHIVTLRVEDDVGASCDTTIGLKVGDRPILTLIEPTPGSVFNQGETVLFRANVSDAETAFTDLKLEWESTLDGVFSTQGADSAGVVAFSETSLSGGTHTVTVTATDEDGLTAVQNVGLTINRLPTQPTIEVLPDPARSKDDLSVNLVSPSTDADGHAILYDYVWYKDGTKTTFSAATVPTSATKRGEIWRAEVTPRDLYGSGTSDMDTTTIQNTLPVLTSAILTPDPATVEDTMSCSPGAVTDYDGDSVSYSYAWKVDGVAVASTSATLTESYFNRGEAVVCIITPNDGYGDGTAMTSNSVTISNSLPTLTTVALTPNSPTEKSTLTCTPVGAYDADGDTVTFATEWYVNASKVSAITPTLTGASFSVGDDVYCSVTPKDTLGSGTVVVSNTVVVENTPPTLTGVTLGPATASETTVLTCTPGTTADDDGDTVSLTYEWELDGVSIAATGNTLTGAVFDKHEEVTCLVTPNDGTEDGTTQQSNVIKIQNTLPNITSVSLTPDPAYELDVLSCLPSGVSDADGDVVTYSYEWMVDSTMLTVGGSTLSGTYFDSGDVVTCTMIPNDGDGDGPEVDSNTITIENSIPTLVSVTLTPTTAYENTTFTCTPGTASDDDGDTISYVYDWSVNGTTLGLGTTTLTGANFDKGDAVSCKVTPKDALSFGTQVTSNVVTVSNSPPTVASASLSPTTAYEPSILSCLAGASQDIDGDTVTLTYQWQINGATIGHTGTTISGTHFNRGDAVNCRIVPSDGTTGTAKLSNVVTIKNSLPTLNTATISPSLPFTDDSLTVSVSGPNDDDGDFVSFAYQWYVNGAAVTSGGTGAALANAKTVKDDTVYVVVTPTDGINSGPSVTAPFVTISNTAPEAPVVDLTPDDAEPADNLSCDIDVGSYDEDSDTVFYTYRWTRNGSTTSYTTRTLSYTNTADGDTWTCYATPNDGDDTGPAGYDSVVVADRTAPDRPIIFSIERYRNENVVVLSGTAEVFSTLAVYRSCDDGSTSNYSTTVGSAGTWTMSISQPSGRDCEYYAVATDTGGNISAASNSVDTEVCDPSDGYEYLEQEICTDPVSEWAALDSDGSVTISIEGNIVDGSDRDWYHVETLQTLTAGSGGASINPYNLEINLSDGAGDYDFFVYRGGCASSDVECSTSGVDTYSYDAYDKGTASHTAPSNRAECKNNSPNHNNCADFSDDIYIKVVRTSAFSCDGYTLDITNGK